MRWLADVAARHPVTLPATYRQLYSTSWYAAGTTTLPWPEALALTQHALADTSCPLGAEEAGWDYPASVIDVVRLLTTADSRESLRAVKKMLPFDVDAEIRAKAAQEVEEARDRLFTAVDFV